MNFLSLFRELLGRVISRKKTLLAFGVVFLIGVILGMLFIKTPSVYGYHLKLCDRFIDRVCYSDRNVFFIFIERTSGNVLLVGLILCAGLHPVGLILQPVILVYRAYMFGGSLAIFFTVYRMSGALIVFVLYLPIHLLIDAVLLCATALSCARANSFRFCTEDLTALVRDAVFLIVLVAAICFLEMVLLLALFHPLGNLL